MALSEDQIDLLRASMQRIRARKQMMAAIFYERLFEIAPHVRPLFRDDLIEQTEKVMIALGAVVAQIHDLDACRDMTRELAVRHVRYGVEAKNYAFVGRAVLATLAEVLAEDFPSDLEAAWIAAYEAIAAAMIAAAYPEELTAAQVAWLAERMT
jgi:hemoglobin-like flavoprotein